MRPLKRPAFLNGPCRVKQSPVSGCGKGPRLLAPVRMGKVAMWLCRECFAKNGWTWPGKAKR